MTVVVVPEPTPDPPVRVLEPSAEAATQVVEPTPEGDIQVPDSGIEHIVVIKEGGPPGEPGPPGPPGKQGDPGPPGPPGGMATYVHNQSILAQTWMVVHSLGKHPAVSIEDGGGSLIYGTVHYLDDSRLTIGFRNAITGRANCV